MKLARAVYELTRGFPRDELYTLTSQIRRAAISIPSNIAEGKGRRTDAEFAQFLAHARGSLLELKPQILLAEQLGYSSTEAIKALLEQTGEVGRMLNGLMTSLSASPRRRGVSSADPPR